MKINAFRQNCKIIPANILFLIDKSNSMFEPADGLDTRLGNMRGAPVDVVGNFNGNYFAAMTANMGINYWNPFTDRWVTNDGTFKNNGISLNDKMYESDYIKGVDGYGSYLYAVIDRSHTNRSSISGLMSIDKNGRDSNKFFYKKKIRGIYGVFNDTIGNKKKYKTTMFSGVGAMSISQQLKKLLFTYVYFRQAFKTRSELDYTSWS